LVTDEHSFDWVWKSEFVEWLKCDAKVFWIAGKPASGKSTLVNYITEHYRTREVAEQALGVGIVIAKFFFDFRAKDGLCNNFEGLRRSLLYKLLTTSNALAAEVMQHFGVNRLDDQIMLADATIFDYALNKNDQPTLLFVDGLDEYAGYKPELLSLVDRITRFNVKVCLSSRYEKPFTITFKDLRFQFRMDELNEPGIYAYAKHVLKTTLRPSDDEERTLNTASEDIAYSSSGVFLWARFAVSNVVDRVCEGRHIEYGWIHTIIHSMPPELEDVYARIFQLISAKDKRACGIILALIDTAKYELELSELFEATLLAGNDFGSLNGDVTGKDLKNFQRYLEAVGSGLIQCFPLGHGEAYYRLRPVLRIRIVHRSIKTYLDSRGWKQLFGEQQALESHHELWLNICHDFLAGKRVRWVVPAQIRGNSCDRTLQPMNQKQLTDCVPFNAGLYDYVHTFLPFHAYRYEQEAAKSSRPLIQKILDPQFVQNHLRITSECWRTTSRAFCLECNAVLPKSHAVARHCSDLQLAISHCLSLYVEEALNHHPEAFESDSFVSAAVVADSDLTILTGTVYSPKPYLYRADSSEIWMKSHLNGPRASPLATAVFWNCHLPSPERSRLVLLLAPHSSRLRELDMLVAIRSLSVLEIEALLIRFPQGPLFLTSVLRNNHVASLGNSFRDSNRMAAEYHYGPLWDTVRRDDIKSVAAILRLFLDRGEMINVQCGPKGTVFHSVAEHQLLSGRLPRKKLELMFGMLMAHGADINATGPEGNVLEYVWKEAHVEDYDRRFGTRMRSFAALVMALIRMGARNSAHDPNGLIPSKARMLAVAESDEPSEEDIGYYFDGRCSYPEAEAYRRQLDGLSEVSPEQYSYPPAKQNAFD